MKSITIKCVVHLQLESTFLKTTTGVFWRCAFVAALFALRPLHVESVVWIAERKDVLSTFFGFSAIWAYAKYAKSPNVARYLPVAALFVLSLMAKPMLVSLPFILLLLDYWPLNRFDDSRTHPDHLPQWLGGKLLEKIPLLFLSAASSVITIIAQEEAMSPIPFRFRLANAVSSYVAYLGKTIYPHPLAPSYSYPDAFPWLNTAGASALILVITILAVKNLKTRPWFTVGWLWFLGSLVPVIGVIQVGIQSMADRYTYVPLIGIFIIAAWGGSEIVSRWHWRQGAATTAAVIILVILSAVTAIQIGIWRNSLHLFEHAEASGNHNRTVYNNLGVVMEKKGRLEEALGMFQKALDHDPRYTPAMDNLAGVLIRLERNDDAIKLLKRSIELKPDQVPPYFFFGRIASKKGDKGTAEMQYRKALSIDPYHVGSNINLGVILKEKAAYAEAEKYFRIALAADVHHAGAHHNLALVFIHQGERHEAVEHLYKAISLEPGQAKFHNDLAGMLCQMGSFDPCIKEYRKALDLEPGKAEIRKNLEKALYLKGNVAPAIERAKTRLKSEPDNIGLLISMGGLHIEQGDLISARAYFGKALSVDPDNVTAMQNLAGIYAMQGDDQRALQMLLQLADVLPDQPQIHYNIACIYSKREDLSESIQWLGRALDSGYSNWDLIASDPDLANVRRAPEFHDIMKNRRD